MARFKPVDYDQNLLLNVTLSQQLVPGSIEWAIHHLIEDGRIELEPFHERYRNDETGRVAYDPRLLLKVILVAYARGVLSSRRMEQLCQENVVFMALTCGATPDHSTIAAFIANMGDLASNLFANVLLICEQEGLLAGTHLSIDGTKLSSNASREWSGKHEDLRKKRDKINKLIGEAIEQHQARDRDEIETAADERRLDRLRASAERIDAFLKESEPRIGHSGAEVQSNITDPDSAKMSTSHGVIQGYNANAMVDDAHQVIVAAEAFGCGTDHGNLTPMLTQAAENLREIGAKESLAGTTVTADTSYFSDANLRACDDAGVDAYIPDPRFRQRDPQLEDADRHRRKTIIKPDRPAKTASQFQAHDFIHEPEHNRLRCPAGKYLYSNGRGIQGGRHAHRFKAPRNACRNCQLRDRCLRKPDRTPVRQVTLFGDHATAAETKRPTRAQRMREKIDSAIGRRTYRKRIAVVEPVFANMCSQKRMDRFTLRGKAKVNVQWLVYCLVHNIGKIARFGNLRAT